MSQLFGTEGSNQMALQQATPYINSRAVSNVFHCSMSVLIPRCVHSVCGPSLKCGMHLHQKGWFSSGIYCLGQASQGWSLQISYVLYPVIWSKYMETLATCHIDAYIFITLNALSNAAFATRTLQLMSTSVSFGFLLFDTLAAMIYCTSWRVM